MEIKSRKPSLEVSNISLNSSSFLQSRDIHETIFVTLEGTNTPTNPWFINLEAKQSVRSSDFKQELLELTREVNRITKWSQKERLKVTVASYFLPHMQEHFTQKIQKNVVAKIKRYLKAKTEIWRVERSLTLEFVHSTCLGYGLIIMRNRSVQETNLSPFQLLIGGDSSWLTPFRIIVNHHVLKNHFAKLVTLGFIHPDDGLEKYRGFLAALLELDSFIAELNPLYDSILFCHFADILLSQIEILNQKTFQELGVKCCLFLTENLKLKYQQKNYRYSKAYIIQSRKFDRIQEFQQILSPSSQSSKITKQFSLMFIPKMSQELPSMH